ncbi:hypothetical protein TNCV_643001 [Trichonephila clavipes]|nr:hypothetical protein TNCV_643001 [Trichonephila clavipes]
MEPSKCDDDLPSLDAGGNVELTGLITLPLAVPSVTHHSVSSCTIRCHLKQSERPPRSPLHRLSTGVCTTNGAMNGGHVQRNGMTLFLLTNPPYACNITMFGF